MKSIVTLALEALELGDNNSPEEYFDPSKQELAQQPHEIEEILPDVPADRNNDRFLDILTSDSYKTCVGKLVHYLGMSIDEITNQYPNCYAFLGVCMGALEQVMNVEAEHKQELEQLAIKVVLDLPEFSLFKEQYENGTLKLDVQLGPGELGDAITMDDIAEEMEENQEDIVDEIAMEIAEDPEKKLKRAFHNFITQGNALHKSYLYNMVNEELENIDETLPTKYGLIMAISHLMYYSTPYMSGQMLKGIPAAGSEEVDGEEIKIRGLIFPVLVHELVKGLFDFLGQDISPETHRDETLEDEYMQLMSGPGLFQKLYTVIPQNKVQLFPIIYRLLLQRDIDEIKAVISNSPEGKNIIDGLVIDAERMYQRDKEAEEEPNEYEPTFDLGLDDDDFNLDDDEDTDMFA